MSSDEKYKYEIEHLLLKMKASKIYRANMQRLEGAVNSHGRALQIRRYAEAMEHRAKETLGANYVLILKAAHVWSKR